ncbi:MAG: 16S rRNA (cytosine(1402)-N(4))-methyltransferase RsmH [Bacteroidota bacterium]
MENEGSKPPRRVRYKGTYPKAFKEKYKELQPEKYADDVEKIILKGNTPAGMHRSICVNEIMDFLQVQPGQVGLDATLGYGGHSAEILKCLVPNGKLFATDVDAIELPKTTSRLLNLGFGPDVFFPRNTNFANIDAIAEEAGPLNFVLADLGVSSMQIDNPDRGFSLKMDGPLDLRLNPNAGIPASQFLKTVSQDELEAILMENADEPDADIIAEAIVSHIQKEAILETTTQLKDIIKEALDYITSNEKTERIKKANQRCFQALRIEVNNEFGVLEEFLNKLPYALAKDGRVAILSFHSGEDRRVKKAFQSFYRQGIFSQIAQDIIRPTPQEVGSNPRARSAKLRWAIKA